MYQKGFEIFLNSFCGSEWSDFSDAASDVEEVLRGNWPGEMRESCLQFPGLGGGVLRLESLRKEENQEKLLETARTAGGGLATR